MKTPYHSTIRRFTTQYDPRHVEAYMRCECGTLDHLTEEDFAAQVAMAAMCIKEGGRDMAERIAKSYGF